jgi:hypothetical protein
VEVSCEHGIEPSGSIKCWEVLEGLHNWPLLKKGSAPKVSNMFMKHAVGNHILRQSVSVYKVIGKQSTS